MVEEEFFCPYCKYRFRNFDDYIDSADFGCEYCGKKFKSNVSKDQRLKHMGDWSDNR